MISAVTPTGRSREIYCSGKVVYSDMLIRFSFVNQYNTPEEDLLYIFNPLELRDFTEGTAVRHLQRRPDALGLQVPGDPDAPACHGGTEAAPAVHS